MTHKHCAPVPQSPASFTISASDTSMVPISISKDEANHPSGSIPHPRSQRHLVAFLLPQDLLGLAQPRTFHGCHRRAHIADSTLLECHRCHLWVRKDMRLVGNGGVLFGFTSPWFKRRVHEKRGTERKAFISGGNIEGRLGHSIFSCGGMDWMQS